MFLFQSPQHLSTEHTNPWGEDFVWGEGVKKAAWERGGFQAAAYLD